MAIYIPAIGPSTLSTMARVPEYNIFGKDGVFKHNFFLISAYRGIEQNFTIEKMLGDDLRDDVVIMGDSGGFQEMSLGKNFGRDKVLDWLDENCHTGMIKDYPCTDADSIQTIREKQQKTAIDATWMLERRKKVLLYNVYLGRSEEQFQQIHDFYGDHEYDGVAIGSLNTNLDNIVSSLLSVIKIAGTKKSFHILGRTGLTAMPVQHYIEHKLGLTLSYDSATYSLGSRLREYKLPFSFKDALIMTDRENLHKIKELPCDCPVCQTANVEMLTSPGGFSGFLLDMHNMYMQIRMTRTLNSLVHNEDKYKDFVGRLSTRAGAYLDLVDTMLEEGVDVALRRHNFGGAEEVSDWL